MYFVNGCEHSNRNSLFQCISKSYEICGISCSLVNWVCRISACWLITLLLLEIEQEWIDTDYIYNHGDFGRACFLGGIDVAYVFCRTTADTATPTVSAVMAYACLTCERGDNMKRVFIAVLTVLFFVGMSIFFVSAQLVYQSIWGNNADFESYKSEFVLVKDHIVENVAHGKMLYLSNDAEHYFDLYDFETKQYLNCPEGIRAALKTISENASSSQETHFNQIEYKDNKIIFGVETVAYALVYSPNDVPYDALGDRPKKEVHCKKIQDDWYHIAVYRF